MNSPIEAFRRHSEYNEGSSFMRNQSLSGGLFFARKVAGKHLSINNISIYSAVFQLTLLLGLLLLCLDFGRLR